tara:strand:- start:7009 stop:7668 length:660 start_codon:yes stop_codon:yes gene_type:complete
MGRAVIFDKDGTLLDFEATWNEAVGAAFDQISDPKAKIRAAELFSYDLNRRCVLPHSPFVSETSDVTDELVADLIDVAEFKRTLNEASRRTVVANKGATETLESLRERGWKLAIATNDSELLAVEHVEALEWERLFTSIKGFDSGHGAKPGPGMVLAAADDCDALNDLYLMVGDSVHDILAGKAAGAITVAIGSHPAALQLADHNIDQLGDLLELDEIL